MRLRYLPLLLSLLVATACATTSIVSNQSPNMTGPYHSMVIVLKTSSRAESFIDPFKQSIQRELALRNITVSFIELNTLSLLTEKDINEQIAGSKAEAVMVIQQTESSAYGGIGMGSYEGSNGGGFDIKLFVNGPNNMVWRGKLNAFGSYGIDMAANSATKKFIAKLAEDGVIEQTAIGKKTGETEKAKKPAAPFIPKNF